MPVGYVAAGASALSAINSLSGGGPGGSGSPYGTYGGDPRVYIPTNQPGADTTYQSLYNQMTPYAQSLPGQVIPGYQQYAGNIQNNPYAGQQIAGANQVATAGQGVGANQLAGAGNLQNAGNQIMTTAFDPQTALYNQLQNQTTQQAAAANAASGVSGPYAAGVTDQALQNFNLAWQDKQLGRQAQGEQAAGQAYSGASGLGNAALSTYGTSSGLPYNTYLAQQGNDLGALNSLTSGTQGAFGLAGQEQNILQSYLGLGQSANSLAQRGATAAFDQNQTLGNQLGQSLSTLSGLGSNLGSLFQSSPYDTAGYGGGVSAGGYSAAYPDYGYGDIYNMG